MANSIMQQVQQLKLLIDQARQQSENNGDSIIEVLRAQFEKEKNEASSVIFIHQFFLFKLYTANFFNFF